ncbi:MAG: acriflavin resistance protein [Lysobacteraceae bacterium]|nr:MAG: acriflavin resistance protein [Xanthomonadaceae bacterium]
MNLIELSTRRRVTISMFCVSLVVFGLISLSDLKTNLLPDLAYPTLTVRTELTGAAPAEIEALLTKPIEEVLGVVKNVTRVRSISRTGQSDVILEFAWGTDMDAAGLDVREKLEVLQLPFEASRPLMLRFNPATDPIYRLGLYVEAEDDIENRLKAVRRFADEDLKRKLEPVAGVAAVKVSGGFEEEIQVYIDQDRLAQLGLPVEEVANRLRRENVNVSGGRLEEGTHRYLVRTVNQFQAVSEVGELLIRSVDGRSIYLRDVATISEGHKERQAIIRMNGREAVEIAIYKEGDANTVAVADAVAERLEKVKEDLLTGMQLEVVDDQSQFIRQAINEVVTAALVGGLLAILIIYCFLKDAWPTYIIALTIPVSVIATFFLMDQWAITLNIMSLGGIALAVGLLVDNAIVVLENIARHRAMGKDAIAAAVDGTSEVSSAIIASTLTTVAVFLPLVFVQGVAGQLFRDQSLTVAFALLVSLVIALTLIPMMSSSRSRSPTAFADEDHPEYVPRTRFGRGVKSSRQFLFTSLIGWIAGIFVTLFRAVAWALHWALKPIAFVVSQLYAWIEGAYSRFLPAALNQRSLVLLVAAGAFAGAVVVGQRLGAELIPELAQGQTEVSVRLAPGTPLAATDQAVARLQTDALAVDGVQSVYSVSGTGNRIDANPAEAGENAGDLLIAVRDVDSEARVIETLRQSTSRMPGLEARFSRPELFSFSTPLEIYVAGFDIGQLRQVSERIVNQLEQSNRFADVKSSLEEGHPELQILFDQDRAARVGTTPRAIAEQVVSKLRGDVATRYTRGDRKIDVLVRTGEEDRQSVDDVRNLIVDPGNGRPVPLSALADIVITEGPTEIRRIDQERVAVISSNLAYGDLGAAVEEARSMLGNMSFPPRMRVRIAGQNEEMEASFRSLMFALGLAVFLVYLVMASQFESLLHPLVILFSIPLALVGAVAALYLSGSTLSVVVFIGLIMLAGIVVNNAIVLITRINQLRESGIERRDAILQAAGLRLRPIVMTTMTTVLGLAPLALGIGEGAEVRAPMAITVIGGLLVSTLLTLVVIPVMYELLDRKKLGSTQADADPSVAR